MKKVIYEVKGVGDEWLVCKTAAVTAKGWLDYELLDGNDIIRGLAKPGDWREKPKRNAK